MPWAVNDRVEVRISKASAWHAGAVRHVPADDHLACPTGCYAVELDTPVSANVWSGVTRKYGGLELVGGASNLVFVRAHVEKVAAGDHMKTEGA